MKKKVRKYEVGGNPCGPGTEWDPLLRQCIPSGDISGKSTMPPVNPVAPPPVMQQGRSGTQLQGARTGIGDKVIPSDVMPIFRGANNEILPDISAGRKDARGNVVPQREVIGDALDKGFNYDSDGVYRKTETTRDDTNLGFSDGFKALNVALDVTRLIAGTANDFQNSKRERLKYLEALQKDEQMNPYEKGLNNVPVYYRVGGENEYPDGGEVSIVDYLNRNLVRDFPQGDTLMVIDPKKGQTLKTLGYATGGQPQEGAELEEGEVFMTQDGAVNKVPEGAGTHEEGGSMQTNVHRVLEDTSDKRKDAASKLLKITQDEAEGLINFRPKRAVSHSKLYEQASEDLTKKSKAFERNIDKAMDYIKYQRGGVFAKNAVDENIMNMEKLPKPADLFDVLYNHQEEVKAKYAIDNPVMATGGDVDDNYYIDPYTVAKTKKGGITPTGKSNAYNKDKDYLKRWEQTIKGISNMDNKAAQQAIYEYTLKNNPDAIKEMWNTYGMTAKGMKSIISRGIPGESVMDASGKFYDDAFEGSNEKLEQALKDSYADGYFGARQLEPPAPATPPNYGPIGPPEDPNKYTVPATPPAVVPGGDKTKYDFNGATKASRFNEPLRWYDTAPHIAGYLSALERTPVPLEQLQYDPLRVHEESYLSQIMQTQGDFNAAINMLPNNGVGFANQANLMSNKYSVDQQAIAGVESRNKQKYDQIDAVNAQGRMQIEGTNLQLRDQFNNRILQGKEIQRQSKLKAFNDYATMVAQNRKLNREGNLVLELTPYFDQNGQFNGQKYIFDSNKQDASSGNGLRTNIEQISGKKYVVKRNAKNEVVSQTEITATKPLVPLPTTAK